MHTISTHRGAILLFLLVRAVITGALFVLTSGEEVASDVRFHHMVFDQPLAVIQGLADLTVSSYPPLQGLLEWPLFHALTLVMPEFLAFRVMFTLIELAAFIVLLAVLDRTTLPQRITWLITALFIIGPHQLLTSGVFVQDEVICQLFVVLAAWYLVQERRSMALVMLGLGVLTGKIFLILPMFYLTVFHRPFLKRVAWTDAWAWLLVLGVYAINVLWALSNNGNVPFVGFSPEPNYGSHYWVLLVEKYPENIELYKRISLLLSVAVQAALCLWFFLQSRKLQEPLNPWILITLPLAAFFFTFYQQNPEYLLCFWPVMLLVVRRVWPVLLYTAVVAMAWVPNLMFGMMNIGINNSSKSGTRNRVLQPVVDALGIDFHQLHPLSIAVYSASYLLMLVALWYLARRVIRQSDPLFN